MEVGLSVSYFVDYSIMANHVANPWPRGPSEKNGTKSQKCLILIVNQSKIVLKTSIDCLISIA